MSSFEWGTLTSFAAFQRIPAFKSGHSLFVIRNGAIEFPDRDIRKSFFSNVTSVGYINVAPPAFEVVTDYLTSSDGVGCGCSIVIQLKLKEDSYSKHNAARQHDTLGSQIEIAVREACHKVFKQLNYRKMRLREPGFDEQIAVEIRDNFEKLPYSVDRAIAFGSRFCQSIENAT